LPEEQEGKPTISNGNGQWIEYETTATAAAGG
jgi:hypothetical protein